MKTQVSLLVIIINSWYLNQLLCCYKLRTTFHVSGTKSNLSEQKSCLFSFQRVFFYKVSAPEGRASFEQELEFN